MFLMDTFVLLLAFLLIFFVSRGVIRMYIDSLLTKRKQHKLKYSNFIDWLTYKKHYSFLPKIVLIWYFSIIATFFVSIISTLIFHVVNLPQIAKTIVKAYYSIYSTVLILAYVMCRFSQKNWFWHWQSISGSARNYPRCRARKNTISKHN